MEVDIIYNEDCLEGMKRLPDKSIDMILCDLPYGVTACRWDVIIPLEPMWEQLKRVIKPNSAIVMTASQPFTTILIASNMKMFRYCWVWNKKIGSNFISASKMPLRVTEDIVVFGGRKYYPIKRKGKRRFKGGGKQFVGIYGDNKSQKVTKPYLSDEYYPTNIIEISNALRKGKVHPTQKPVALMEYLIRTYTNKDEIVLDFAMGSGTTALACKKLGRHYIGCEIARRRLSEIQLELV